MVSLLEENNRLLKENHKLSEQNAKKLKRITSNMRRNTIGRIIYWLIIIGLTIGGWYVAKPYVDTLVQGYNKVTDQLNKVSDTLDKAEGFIPSLPTTEPGKDVFSVIQNLFQDNTNQE